MLISAETLGDRELLAAQVVIVGAGAVGLVMAVELARAGVDVLLIEAGAPDLTSDSQALFEAARSVGARPHEGLHAGRFRMLGGTTNFWGGQLVQLWPALFGNRPWVRDDAAWPITADDLKPFYTKALALLGMAHAIGSDEDVIARLHQPLPPLSSDLRYFFTRWAPQPNLAHHFDGDLRNNAHLRCVYGIQATGFDVVDGSVTAVNVIDARGRQRAVRGQQIVLANGTVEIARLLLAPSSSGGAAPWSGNRWLGRGFMDHLEITAGTIDVLDKRKFSDTFENALLNGIKYQPKIRLTEEAQVVGGYVDVGAHLIFNSTYAEHLANAKIFLRSFLRGRIDQNFSSYPAKIKSLVRIGLPMAWRYVRSNRIAMMADRGIALRVSVEQIMVAESGIRLGAARDALGLPVVELDWRVDGRELETMAHFTERVAAFLEGSGLARVEIDPLLQARDPAFLNGASDTNHQMGMARMSRSPDNGVVDSELKVFGTHNLHVAGAAVYPSTGFPNPTFTAMALGLRLAERLRTDVAR